MSHLTELVERLLLIYKTDPDAAEICLATPLLGSEEVSEEVAAKKARSARNRARTDLRSRTLIETKKITKAESRLKQEGFRLEDHTQEEIREFLDSLGSDSAEASPSDPQADAEDIDYSERLLSFFLERLDSMAEVVQLSVRRRI